MAADIIKLMPPHTHYVEPFFGGGSVLLDKDPEGVSEVVNDINRDLTNFWRVLQDEDSFAAFKRRIDAVPFSQIEFEDAACPGAAPFFIRCRQSRAGSTKSFATLSRNRVRRGMNEQASAWLACVDGLPEVHARLRRVVILNQDAVDVIRQQDGQATLFYCDPPYVLESRAVKDHYAHEMTDEQHRALLNTLSGIAGKFMLSGYRCELYDKHAALHGWRREDFDCPNQMAGGAEKRRRVESVWMNF